MSVSMFHLHMSSLIELKQTETVVGYTAAFWERLHPVLDLNSNLKIKSFVNQYIEGLREDIQEVVRSRSPSSITSASVLARIREEEIGKDTVKVKGADKLGASSGLIATEILPEAFPEPAAPVQYRAGQSAITIDVSCSSALTPTTCLMECPGSDATVDVLAKLAASAERDEDLDTVSVAALPPSTYSTGGLAHGRDADSFAAVSLVLWTTNPSSKAHADSAPTESQRPFSALDLDMCSTRCFDCDITVLTLPLKLDVTPSNSQQGQILRPWPWPSFADKHGSTAHGGIVETPLRASKTPSEALVPCSTWWPLLSTLEAYLCISSLVPLSVMDGFRASSYLDTVEFCAWSQEIMPDFIHSAKVCQGEPVFCLCIEYQLKRIRLAPWLSQEILEEAAFSTKAFSIIQDGTRGACDCHVYKKKQICMFRESSMGAASAYLQEWLILVENILVCALCQLRSVKNLIAAEKTCCETEEFDLVNIYDCMRIVVELKPWPSWDVADCCMAFYWGFLQNASSAIISAAVSSVLQLMSNLLDSPSCMFVHALRSFSVMWYLDVVFGRLEKWWPRTHFLQKTTVVISEAHSKFLDTSVPAQLDDLLPPSKPPDSSEGCATMCSGEGCDQFSTREVKVISLDISSTELMLNCYSLLEPMQSLIGGQCTYAGDWLTKILERYIQPRGKINVIFSCPCPKQVYRLQDSLEVAISWRLEKWSHTQSVQPANAVFEAHYKLLDTTEVFSIEPSLEPALLSRYLVFFWYTEPKHSAWHFSLVHPVQIAYCLNTTELFSTASVPCLCILGYMELLISVKSTVGSMKKTCDLVGPMDHLKDGQGIQILEKKTLRKNADCQSVRSVSAQLKCDGIECHFDHILNPQIWELQVTIRLVKVGWQNLMLQKIVCGLSAWEPATVCLVKILAVVIKLQVPWDPCVQFVLGEFGVSACGQADSQGEANVMTVATQKLMGQVMTWAWTGIELGLAGSVREYRKEATQMRRASNE